MNTLKISQDYEGENLTPVIVKYLGKNIGTKRIVFEKGIYDFHEEGCYRGVFYPSNNQSGEKKVVFPIIGIDNLEIDGNGSTFVFHDRIFPFIVQNSKNVVLKNFTIDFSFPRYAHGEVLDCDEKGFTLNLDKQQFPYIVSKEGNLIFQAGSTEINSANKCFFVQSHTRSFHVFFVEIGQTKTPLKSKCEGVDLVQVNAKQVRENTVRFSYKENSPKRDFRIGNIIIINNDEDRENAGLFFDSCQNVYLQNINIYRVAGMGVVAQLCRDIFIDKLNISVPSDGRKDLVSATADALHFINCFGKLQVKNSFIKDTVDDGFNAHGNYMQVKRVEKDKIYLRFCHFEQEGKINLYSQGDIIAVSDGVSEVEKGITTVVDSFFEGEEVVIKTNGGVLINEGDFIENKTKMPQILLENNEFINEPHLRFSGPQEIVIKNNTFENIMCPIYIRDLLSWWCESGAVTDVKIEGNVFKRTCRPIDIGMARKEGHNVFHKNIAVRNNYFEKDNWDNLLVAFVDGFTFENNTCLFTDDVKKSLRLVSCKNIAIKEKK